MSKLSRPLALILLSLSGSAGAASAYDIDTHRALGLRAAKSSLRLDQVLREDLGFQEGATTGFAKQIPEQWIRTGAGFEDISFLRVRNHFHNPLQPWGIAGLFVPPIQFQSSVLWGQRAEQDSPQSELAQGGGTWSWPFARNQYLQALTAEVPGTREEAFAKAFRALGQLTHLIQDATVPAHVRNDPHPHVPVFGMDAGDPDPYETWVQNARGKEPLNSFINASPVMPAQSVFGPTGDNRAPAPIAGLIDTKTFVGLRPDLLGGTAIGAAEYTNGNFLSKDRLFLPDFPFPRISSLNLASPIVEPEGNKFRRYFRKTGDGQEVEHFVGEGLLHKSILEARGAPLPRGFTLTSRVQQDYAQNLLPRAVGYSAALIDYFFRGTLQLDLLPDDVDPSLVRLKGTNASTDTLVDGTLTLYADDASGNRTAVTPLDPDSVTVTDVAPAGLITSGRFQPPAGAERFVAVYQGTLGNEAKNPDQNVRGGVIGKVLGGVRVEEVFNDGSQWRLRTPKGVFGLTTESGPLTVAQYEVVKWGDTDSALIARSPLSASAPQVAVFDVPRQPGSSELDIPSGATDIVVSRSKSVPFPSSVLLATVNFTQTVVYRQHLARAEKSETAVWVPDPPPNPDPDNRGAYNSGGISYSPFTFEVAYEQTIPFAQSFPVRLDLPHNIDSGTVFNPYFWRLRDVTVDASGRPLGVVVVALNTPQVASVTVPVFRVNASGADEQYAIKIIAPSFPQQISTLLWALVNLENGTVVASTAGPVITINPQAVSDEIDAACCGGSRTFFVHSTLTYNTSDLKFHRLQPSLEMTALPATLAPLTNVPAHRAGNYHSIRLVAP